MSGNRGPISWNSSGSSTVARACPWRVGTPDEMPLKYLYRLNVAVMRANIFYADGTADERREHVELFINTLGSQEQDPASRLTLMEVQNVSAMEKKLRARQRGLVHQKKTLFGSSKFRQTILTSPAPGPCDPRHDGRLRLRTDKLRQRRLVVSPGSRQR
ncbi:unnamed protein product [Phytophthora fragariaefolia]|uniref:Unnamed protein product n=1 Tax=Phytophthora fragariaefolia TaxID=1490495 RepID=A0A9W6U254_9STRA|nr:unnamed protein product [Phytophthora fragariaefolia]